jgi:hypothetical protein
MEVCQDVKSEHEIHLQRSSFHSSVTSVIDLLNRGPDVQISTSIITFQHIGIGMLATKLERKES